MHGKKTYALHQSGNRVLTGEGAYYALDCNICKLHTGALTRLVTLQGGWLFNHPVLSFHLLVRPLAHTELKTPNLVCLVCVKH